MCMGSKRKYIIVGLMLMLCYGCAIKRNLQQGINMMWNAILVPRVVSAQFLVDAASAIYVLDTLADSTPVVIKTFDVRLIQKGTVFLPFRDISVYKIGNRVVFDTIIWPEIPLQEFSNDVTGLVECKYRISKYTRDQCLYGRYAVMADSMRGEGGFSKCE